MAVISDQFLHERIKFAATQLNVGQGDATSTGLKVASWVLDTQRHVIESSSLNPNDRPKITGIGVVDRPFLPVVTGWSEKIGFLCPRLKAIHPTTSLERNLLLGNLRHLNGRLIDSLQRHELRDPDIVMALRVAFGYTEKDLETGVFVTSDETIRDLAVSLLRDQVPIPQFPHTWQEALEAINRGIYVKALTQLNLNDPAVLQKLNYLLGTLHQPAAVRPQEARRSIEKIALWIFSERGEKILPIIAQQFPEKLAPPISLFNISDIAGRFRNPARAVQTAIDTTNSPHDYPIYDPEFQEIRFVPEKVFQAFAGDRDQHEIVAAALDYAILVLQDGPAAEEEFPTAEAVCRFLVKLQKLSDRGFEISSALAILLVERMLLLPPQERESLAGQEVVKILASIAAAHQNELPLQLAVCQLLEATLSSEIADNPTEPSFLLWIEEEFSSPGTIASYLEDITLPRTRELVLLLAEHAQRLANENESVIFSLPDSEIAAFLRSLEKVRDQLASLSAEMPNDVQLKHAFCDLAETVKTTTENVLCDTLEDLMAEYEGPQPLGSKPKWAQRYQTLLAAGQSDPILAALIEEHESAIASRLLENMETIDLALRRKSEPPAVVKVKEVRSQMGREKLLIDSLQTLRGAYARIDAILEVIPEHLKEPLGVDRLKGALEFFKEIYEELTHEIALPEIDSSDAAFRDALALLNLDASLEQMRNNYIAYQEGIRSVLVQLVKQTVLHDPRRDHAKSYQRYLTEIAKVSGKNVGDCNVYQEITQFLAGRLAMPLDELIKCTPAGNCRQKLEEVHAMLTNMGHFAQQVFSS